MPVQDQAQNIIDITGANTYNALLEKLVLPLQEIPPEELIAQALASIAPNPDQSIQNARMHNQENPSAASMPPETTIAQGYALDYALQMDKLKGQETENAEADRLSQLSLKELFPELYDKNSRIGPPERIFQDMRDAAQEARQYESLYEKLQWLRGQETNHAIWDFKDYYKKPNYHITDNPRLANLPSRDAPKSVQDYNNFHYAAIAFVLGVSEEMTMTGAGCAQLGGTEGKGLESLEGKFNAAKNYALASILPKHGDNPEDQLPVRAGWRWAKLHASNILGTKR